MERAYIRKVTREDNVAKISITGVEDAPGNAYVIFSALSERGVCVDTILQVTGRENKKDITFTVATDDIEEITGILSGKFSDYGLEYNNDVSKISVIGSGMINQPGIAASIFEIMDGLNIDIQMVSTSEMTISLIIDKADADRALRRLREKLEIM